MRFLKVVSGIFAIIVFIVTMGLVGRYESTYSRLATCISFDDGIYSFKDNAGNIWEWEQEKNDIFYIGNVYKLVMHDNLTSTITDDSIINIKNY